MYCIHCGYKNSDDALFCVKCGRPMPDEIEEKAKEKSEEKTEERSEIESGVKEDSVLPGNTLPQEPMGFLNRADVDGQAFDLRHTEKTGTPEKGNDAAAGDGGADIFSAPPMDKRGSEEGNRSGPKRKTGLVVGAVIAVGVVLIAAVVAGILVFNGKNRQAYERQVDRGEACMREADYDEAIEAFKKAMEIDASEAPAYTGLCDVYIILGDYNRAMEVIDYGLSVVDDTQPLEDKQREIQNYLDNGNPGALILPDPSEDETEDSSQD